MKKVTLALSLIVALALLPTSQAFAISSSSGTAKHTGGGVHGKIISVTTTNFSMGSTTRGRHRRTRSTLVHYNPSSVTITVDGVTVSQLDVAATGKYVSVVGVMKNNVLEATSITVTSTAPAHAKKGKSSSK
jgi:redox-regulated HSP33 family molecular chaperone